MQEFHLLRRTDVSGTSGTGVVAHGVILKSGKVVLEWKSFVHTITIFDSITAVEEIHGHDGCTCIVMGSPEKPKKGRKKNDTKKVQDN